MIEFVHGNLFEAKAEALVNTVNCVGVMGKGIAHQFKRQFPAMFKDYKAKCSRKEIRLGEVSAFREGGVTVINFPTKNHWRAKSRLPDIRRGLESLREYVLNNGIKSVAVPPLGCGNGGLDWQDVRPAIETTLGDLEDVHVLVYEPRGRFQSRVAKAPKLSLSHVVLIQLRLGIGSGGSLLLQKAGYFFNVFAGADYFKYSQYKYGPYSVALDPMGRAIRDYMDATGLTAQQIVEQANGTFLAGTDVDKLTGWSNAIEASVEYCRRNARQIEQLSTAHAVVKKHGPVRTQAVIEKFLTWSPEKSEKFSDPDVTRALDQLERDGLIIRTLWGWEAVERPSAEHLRTVTASLEAVVSADLLAQLERYCTANGTQPSQIVESALAAWLANNDSAREEAGGDCD